MPDSAAPLLPPVPGAARVAQHFGAAERYEQHAQVQAEVAAQLARRVAQGGTVSGRLLEIGCGTGLLTRALVAEGLGGDWLITDLAPEMVARCRAGLADVANPRLRYATMDGADPRDTGACDLIVSSLAFQWFADPRAALARLAACLAPGGALWVATLLEGTFSEWRTAHEAVGARSGGIAYPDAAALSAMAPAGGDWAIDVLDYTLAYPDARAFLRAVKGIGAGAARADHVPLPATTMRQVMRAFDALGARATYRVGYCCWRRPAS